MHSFQQLKLCLLVDISYCWIIAWQKIYDLGHFGSVNSLCVRRKEAIQKRRKSVLILSWLQNGTKKKKRKKRIWCLGKEAALGIRNEGTNWPLCPYPSLLTARYRALTAAMYDLADPVRTAMPARNSHQLYPINISFSYLRFPHTLL